MPAVVRVATHVHHLASHSCLAVQASCEHVCVYACMPVRCHSSFLNRACLFECKHARVGAILRHSSHEGFDLEV